MWFCAEHGKSKKNIFEIIRKAFDQKAMSRAKGFEWHSSLKNGITPSEDEGRSGKAPGNTTFKTFRIIWKLIMQKNRRVTIQEVVNFAEQGRAGHGSYGTEQAILTYERSPFWNRERNLVRIAEHGRHASRKCLSRSFLMVAKDLKRCSAAQGVLFEWNIHYLFIYLL